MICKKKVLWVLIAISLLACSAGCLGRNAKSEPRLYFITRGAPSPIDGVVMSRDDFVMMLERIEEARSQ